MVIVTLKTASKGSSMKRSTARLLGLLILLLVAAVLPLSAENDVAIEPPFLPMSPAIMGQGGSSIAVVRGYDALFSNPAGFVGEDGSWTLLTANPWVYANPVRFFQPVIANPENAADAVATEITAGGFGVGASTGIGYVGRGLGLGISIVADSYLYGQNLMGAAGYAHTTIAFIGGYATTASLLGIDFHMGFAVRPMFRIHVPVDNEDALALVDVFSGQADLFTALNDVDALHGIGLGFDAGVVADFGSLKLAVAARDILGTKFAYNTSRLGDILQSFDQGFPDGTPIDDVTYRIPMNISVGAALEPSSGFLGALLDPVFHAELRDIVGVIKEGKSPWTLLHMGAEFRLFSLLALRAGLYQGYLTMGAGLNLGIAEINAAVFTRELGKHLKDRPNTGMSAEIALRF